MKKLFPIAYNYIAPVPVEALKVIRKGKLIKGETAARIDRAMKERNEMRNAAKRLRKARRAA